MSNRVMRGVLALYDNVDNILEVSCDGYADGYSLVPRSGVSSVVNSATGTYVITLQDRYISLLGAHPTLVSLDGSAHADLGLKPVVLSSSVNSNPPTVTIGIVNASGALTALATPFSVGLNVLLVLKKSTPV